MKLESMIFFVIYTLVISRTNSYRILAVIPTPSFSHQQYFRPIWIELSQRGHQVTLVTTDPINDPKLVNLTEIDVHYSYKLLNNMYNNIHNSSNWKVISVGLKSYDEILDSHLSDESFKNLIRNESLFDVVITEAVLYEFVALADLYKCPKILVTSFGLGFIYHGYLGNPINPVSSPDILLPYEGGTMNFQERLSSCLYQAIYFAFKKFYHNPKRHDILKKHFGGQVRSPSELLSDVDFVFSNDGPLLSDVRAVGPNLIPFGGGLHLHNLKPLPKDLKEYLDDATEGCIYFSLGTNSKSMFMSREKIQIISEAISELPYKFLWKFELEDLITPPKNVKLSAWVPQQDVLRHPNVKLFVTQGGMQSLEESILSRVPLVMMPMYGDQQSNCKRMEHRGLGRILPHKPLPDKEVFKSTILDVMNNPIYRENVNRTAELMMDQPMKTVDKAVWWIEYVIRHKGAKHLRNPAADIPLYQYYCLDVIGAISLFLYIVFKMISMILRKSCSFILWMMSKNAKKKNKKKEH